MKIIKIKQTNVLKVVKTLTLVLSPVSLPAFRLDHINAIDLVDTLNYLIEEKIVIKLLIQNQGKYWLAAKQLPEFLIFEDFEDILNPTLKDITYVLDKEEILPKAKPVVSAITPSTKTLDTVSGPIELLRNGKSVFKTAESFLIDEADRLARLRIKRPQISIKVSHDSLS